MYRLLCTSYKSLCIFANAYKMRKYMHEQIHLYGQRMVAYTYKITLGLQQGTIYNRVHVFGFPDRNPQIFRFSQIFGFPIFSNIWISYFLKYFDFLFSQILGFLIFSDFCISDFLRYLDFRFSFSQIFGFLISSDILISSWQSCKHVVCHVLLNLDNTNNQGDDDDDDDGDEDEGKITFSPET